jgi:hypothetical protein
VSHTPGPWEFDYEAGEVSAPNGTVVLYPTMLPDEAEEVANGHLVAAAPDLLAALEDCVNRMRVMGVDPYWLEESEAAIKKAKGQ